MITQRVTEKVTKQVTKKFYNKGFKKAEEKAYEKEVNVVLKMINKNCDDEFIQNVTDFTIKEINKIREEHSNQ